ncbi:MAG: hypothetical protein HYY06_31220 [Deltaproteobacteria bacterium]|nr:hypothetical protein [Deltaproteobacteria bacterium]
MTLLGPIATIEDHRFLVRAAENDASGLVELGKEADRLHHAIRAAECFAEAARCGSENAAGPLRALMGRAEGVCWLCAHPSHSATLAGACRASAAQRE